MLREIAEDVRQRRAEAVMLVEQAELGADRVWYLVAYHLQSPWQGMSGAQRACDDLGRFGQQLFELAQPLSARVHQQDDGKPGACESDDCHRAWAGANPLGHDSAKQG